MLRQLQTAFNQFYDAYIATKSVSTAPASTSVSGRARTSYKANVTASLMLPEIYCEVPYKAQTKPTTSGIISWLTPWLPKNLMPVQISQETPKEEESTTQCIKLREKIQTLEKQRQQTEDEKLQDKILEEEVDLNAGRIRQHAALRADLFFYLLVAVYKTYHTVIKDKTVKQHGKGSKSINTQACHSSIFSNIALTPHTQNHWGMFSPIKPRDLKGTQFAESLNLTVELPSIVNAFDGHLEGRYQPTKYVQQILVLLQQCSMGTITPKEGMLGFFKIMNIFFGKMELRFAAENDANNNAVKKVCCYEKEGTFMAANADLSIQDSYLHLMLRLKDSEILAVKCSNKLLDRYYFRIQDEIYQNKSVLNDEPSPKPQRKPGGK